MCRDYTPGIRRDEEIVQSQSKDWSDCKDKDKVPPGMWGQGVSSVPMFLSREGILYKLFDCWIYWEVIREY